MARTTFDGKIADIYSSALDPTNQKQAVTQQDVMGQDYATRLWQSLNYSYGQQREQSDKQYDQAIGATDRAALQRGMGRSSYTTQTLANLGQQKVDAWNNIYSAQVADYQNRLNDEENSDRQLAASYLNAIISAGGTPSDDLLRRAGLSRSDAMAMIQQPKYSGGGSSGGTPKPSGLEGEETETPPASSELGKLWEDEQPKPKQQETPSKKLIGAYDVFSKRVNNKATDYVLPYQVNPTSKIR